MNSAKWWMVLLAVAAMAGSAVGKEITLKQAETAVGNWVARGGAFGKLASNAEVSGETFVDPDTGAKMHVVRVPGKGFAVTSADDGIEPIILFSDGDGEFVAEEGNPLWDLLRWDLAAREKALEEEEAPRTSARDGTLRGSTTNNAKTPQGKWAELLEDETMFLLGNTPKATVNMKTSISDIRRDAILATAWGQREANGQPAYNYYTPGKQEVVPVAKTVGRTSSPVHDATAFETNEVGHYPCGCVATAGGQLMKKWKYPSAPKTKKTVMCTRDGSPLSLTMKGGTYNWTGMGGATPATEPQCEAVGRILFDIGVSCGADYTADGTSMSASDLASNLRTVFGYKSSTWFGTAFYEFESTVLERLKKIAIPNLDAGAPILLSIKRSRFNEAINHCVVADGYGYDNGEFSIHINFGWNGTGNGWYVPPSFHPSPKYDYDFIRGVVGNVFPNGTGSVASGRAEGAHGRPVRGVQVQLCTTSGSILETKTTGSDGVYWFMQEPGSYMVKAGAGSVVATGTLELSECGDAAIGNVVQDWSLTSVPTVASISAVVGKGKAVRDGGDATFATPFEVRLSSGTAGAEIRYTVDGTQPTPESAAYEGPIEIQDTTVLRAVAYADGMECSEEFTRTWTFNDPTSRDNFADARLILGASGKSSFNNAGYTKEEGEPTHSSKGTVGGASAWAVWTAPSSGDWTFRLSGIFRDYPDEEMDTQLAVYTGDVVSNLTQVAANDDANRNEEDYSSRVSFSAEAGTTYHIAMDSYRGTTYPGTLTLEWEEGWVDWAQFEYTPQWVPSSGGEWGMDVEASANWNVTDHSDWIEPIAYTGEAGGHISYRVEANSTGSERTGYVTVQAGNSGFTSLAVRQHTLDFVTTKEAALDRAWRENKRIFLIYGREGCGNTRATMFSSMPSVKALLDAGYVLWYSNCDRQREAGTYSAGSTLPTVAILDPLDMSKAVAAASSYQSASALRSLIEGNASWPGLPRAQIALVAHTAASATVTTKVRTWGSGASGATVTLETAGDAAFAGAVTTRQLGTITEIWTEQKWTFGPPSATEAAYCRVRVTSGDWSVVSDVAEFIPLGVALDNTALSFASEGEIPWWGQTMETHDGKAAACCVNPSSADTNLWTAESSLKTTIRGPGRLSFWWRCDGNYGWLNFYADGTRVASVASEQTWEACSWDVASTNSVEVEWNLWRRNSSDSFCTAMGWVDQVTWTPGNIVTLDRQGGWNGPGAVLAVRGEPLREITCPVRTGYTFGGYYDGTNGSGTQYYTATGESVGTWDRSGDATLYAKWIPVPCTVTLDWQDGTGGTSSVTATYGERLPSITVPTRTGYDFGGYYTGEGGSGERYYNAAGVGVEDWNTMSNAILHAFWFEQADVTWNYRIENGVATVTGASPLRGRLEIPATLGGCPVGEIGYQAFENADDVTEVVIPSCVTDIGIHAFYDCDNLASVTIPEGVKTIDSDSFFSCDSLTSIYIPSSVEEIGIGCNGLATIDGINLSAIEVAPGNAVYASEDGVLFSKDKSAILRVPSMKTGEYVIPAGVTVIGFCAFAYNNRLTSVTIPDSVTFVGQSAFGWCWGLDSLIIPDSVTTIAYYAFWNSSLSSLVIPDSVTYCGEGVCGACWRLERLEVPGTWWGTDFVSLAEPPASCEVTYRGISPLAVVTETLPPGTAETAYEARLSATGGVAPYAWSEGVAPHSERTAASTYAAMGVAKGWQGDDSCWDLALPFAFPYFGRSYTTAKVNSNGAISFGKDNFTANNYIDSSFKGAPIVAVMWEDLDTRSGDIYVESGGDKVTVRWSGAYFSSSGDGGAVNVSATLHKDGRIVLSYGEGNASGGTIGLSAGDGQTMVLSAKSGSGSLENADDIVFTPGAGLPSWLALSADGMLSGMPTAAGEWTVPVAVTDAKGVCARQNLALTIAGAGPGTETTPVVVPHAWLVGYGLGDGTAEGYEAAANAQAANGMKVWECYWAGLDPTDTEAAFKVKSIAFKDGMPKLEWEPDLSNAGMVNRHYVVWGRKSIDQAEDGEGAADGWMDVTGQEATWVTNGWHFFKVNLEMPE